MGTGPNQGRRNGLGPVVPVVAHPYAQQQIGAGQEFIGLQPIHQCQVLFSKIAVAAHDFGDGLSGTFLLLGQRTEQLASVVVVQIVQVVARQTDVHFMFGAGVGMDRRTVWALAHVPVAHVHFVVKPKTRVAFEIVLRRWSGGGGLGCEKQDCDPSD